MKQPQKLLGHFCILVIQNGSSAASICSLAGARPAGKLEPPQNSPIAVGALKAELPD